MWGVHHSICHAERTYFEIFRRKKRPQERVSESKSIFDKPLYIVDIYKKKHFSIMFDLLYDVYVHHMGAESFVSRNRWANVQPEFCQFEI